MYHLELRHFPHTAWRFNLSEQEVRAIVTPWAQDRMIELGERRWSPERARLTVLEGPELALPELAMGRGWRNAQRSSRDVTAELLRSLANEPVPAPVPAPPAQAAAPPAQAAAPAAADSLATGVMLASLLGPDALALLERWRAISAARPELRASEALGLAERQLSGESGA